MATIAQEKRPSEVIQLSVDFVNTLLTGESIIPINVSVIITNTLTDVVSTPSILATTPSVIGSVVSFQVQGGSDGDCFSLLIKTGQTTGGNFYETTANLIITLFPATENPLTTRDEVKRQLKVDDASDDRLLDDLILSASAYIRNRTNKVFHLKKYVEKIRIGCDGDPVKVKLANYPVLKIDNVQFYDNLNNLIDSVSDPLTFDFVDEGYLWFTDPNWYFFQEPGYNVITYRAGYKKIPEDLRQACKDLVIAFYRAVGREGLSSEKIGDYAYTKSLISSWPDALRREIDVPYVEGVIRRYCRHDFDYESTY